MSDHDYKVSRQMDVERRRAFLRDHHAGDAVSGHRVPSSFRVLPDTADLFALKGQYRAEFEYRVKAWSGGQLHVDKQTADRWWRP